MILLWRVSTRCNFACGFCAYDRRLALPVASVDPAIVDRFALLAADLAAQRGEPLLLSWLGGEPFLWPPLLDLSERLSRHPAMAISATSNGTRLHDRAVRARVLSSFAELTLSLDGPAEIHDALRGTPGSFSRIRAAITALVAEREALGARLKLRVNTVLMRETLPHFHALCHELASWGVDEITFNQLGSRDRPEFFPAQRLLPDDASYLATMVPILRKALVLRGTRLCAAPDYLRRIDASARDEPLAVKDCRPGEVFLFVDEAGRIGPCSFTAGSHGINAAEIATVDDLASLPHRFRSAQETRPARICGDCPSTQFFGKFAA